MQTAELIVDVHVVLLLHMFFIRQRALVCFSSKSFDSRCQVGPDFDPHDPPSQLRRHFLGDRIEIR